MHCVAKSTLFSLAVVGLAVLVGFLTPRAEGPFPFIYNPRPEDPRELHATDSLTLQDLVTKGAPKCTHPRLIRGALRFPPEDAERCKADNCRTVMRERTIKIFGNASFQAYPMKELGTPLSRTTRHRIGLGAEMTGEEYLTNPKWDDWVCHTLTQLGDWDQYRAILDMKNANKFPDNITEFDALTNLPNRDYAGSFIFFSRGNTGSHMHYAIGSNVFLHLAGIKRWVLVHPDWWGLPGANCSQTPHGGHGICFPDNYQGENQPGVSIEDYVAALLRAGVPRGAILTFDIYPGDVFINCDLWPHALQDMTPSTMAWSLRYPPTPPMGSGTEWSFSTFNIVTRGIFTALRTKIVDPVEPTMLEGIWSALWGFAFLDKDVRYSTNAFRDQDNDD